MKLGLLLCISLQYHSFLRSLHITGNEIINKTVTFYMRRQEIDVRKSNLPDILTAANVVIAATQFEVFLLSMVIGVSQTSVMHRK